jgi:hypothetical protein
MNIRYVITHVNKDGTRTLAQPMQGRHTHATPENAQREIDAIMANNSDSTLRSVFGLPLEVRAVECWPAHHDPKTRYFDN